jgi:membrane fusion protein, multidrug efflux system
MANEEEWGAAQASGSAQASARESFWHRHRHWLWLALLLLAVLILVLFFVRRHQRAPTPPAPAAVSAAPARSGDINVYVSALGTVTPLATINVYSQITGRVESVHYEEGQMVRKGSPLIDIDPLPYQSTLQQAQGNLQRDTAVLAEARMDLARYQAAYARNAIARQQLEDQQQAVVQDEGTVQADQGTVAYDRVQLAYCHIVSPVSGRVGLRLVDPGNTVFAGSSSTLVVVTQLQPITVVFDVAEDQLPSVQAELNQGQKLAVDAFDRTDQQQLDSGALTAYDNQIDPTTGTVRLRARFTNDKLALFPNQFVNARLLLRTLHQATLVPAAAVQYNGSDSFVYVVESNGTVRVQPVTVQTSNDTDSAVQGISPGTSVVTSGFERIENGVRVAVEAPAPAAAPATAPAGTPAPAPVPSAPQPPGQTPARSTHT